jgi:hypothetical protein
MDVAKIRELRTASPFKPFRLILRDGRELPVERSSFLAISPTNKAIAYASNRGGFDFLSIRDIEDAVVDEKLHHWR